MMRGAGDKPKMTDEEKVHKTNVQETAKNFKQIIKTISNKITEEIGPLPPKTVANEEIRTLKSKQKDAVIEHRDFFVGTATNGGGKIQEESERIKFNISYASKYKEVFMKQLMRFKNKLAKNNALQKLPIVLDDIFNNELRKVGEELPQQTDGDSTSASDVVVMATEVYQPAFNVDEQSSESVQDYKKDLEDCNTKLKFALAKIKSMKTCNSNGEAPKKRTAKKQPKEAITTHFNPVNLAEERQESEEGVFYEPQLNENEIAKLASDIRGLDDIHYEHVLNLIHTSDPELKQVKRLENKITSLFPPVQRKIKEYVDEVERKPAYESDSEIFDVNDGMFDSVSETSDSPRTKYLKQVEEEKKRLAVKAAAERQAAIDAERKKREALVAANQKNIQDDDDEDEDEEVDMFGGRNRKSKRRQKRNAKKTRRNYN